MRTSVAISKPIPQTKTNIEGLEALESADLMVMFTRFRALPDDHSLDHEVREFRQACRRPAHEHHAFLYPEGSPHTALNDGFGRDVFGQKWITHHGNKWSTSVTVNQEQAKHPILQGVTPFQARSWLYHVLPLNGPATILLEGDSINSQQTAKAASPATSARRLDARAQRRPRVLHHARASR